MFRFVDVHHVNSVDVLEGLVVMYVGTSSFLISVAILLRWWTATWEKLYLFIFSGCSDNI